MNRPFGWLLDHRLTPRVVLGGLVLAFVAQLEVIRLYGEPYPALVMPEFRGGGAAPGRPLKVPQPLFVGATLRRAEPASLIVWLPTQSDARQPPAAAFVPALPAHTLAEVLAYWTRGVPLPSGCAPADALHLIGRALLDRVRGPISGRPLARIVEGDR